MEFYTLKEVAKMLRVSMTTIYRYVESGKLNAVKIGNSYRVTDEDLRKFIDDCRVATDAKRAAK